MITIGIFFSFSANSFCICKAFLALAKASRDRLPLLPATEVVVPSVLDFPVTSSDLIILTPSFSWVVVIEDTLVGRGKLEAAEAIGTSDATASGS